MSEPQGFLAIWSDVSDSNRTDYLHWLTREHVEERLAVPGFETARVFRARREDVNRYLILYELRDAGVLGSAPYLARLNNPTPWSNRIMGKLTNFKRGGGRVQFQIGSGHGGFLAPIILQPSALRKALNLQKLALPDRICSISFMETDIAGTEIATVEKALRKNDQTFIGLMLFEGIDDEALADYLSHGPHAKIADFSEARTPVYDVVFTRT